MRKVAVKIAYQGSEFFGSQIQPHHRTVEGEILKNLSKVHGPNYKDSFDLKAAGRTDAGVNALGNVVSFVTRFDDDKRLLRALNGVSKDVYYRAIAQVNDEFNPRFAERRVYRYVMPMCNIDITLAKECAELFEGKHDFKKFCKVDERNTVINIDKITVDASGDTIVLTFTAQFFLWNMIRRLSAAIASVGSKEHTLDDVRNALNGNEVQFGTGRPDALTLLDVIYPKLEFQYLNGKSYDETISDMIFSEKLRYDFLKSLKQ